MRRSCSFPCPRLTVCVLVFEHDHNPSNLLNVAFGSIRSLSPSRSSLARKDSGKKSTISTPKAILAPASPLDQHRGIPYLLKPAAIHFLPPRPATLAGNFPTSGK